MTSGKNILSQKSTGLRLALLLILVVSTLSLSVHAPSQNEYQFVNKWYSRNSNLRSLAVDGEGNIYVASAANNNIVKYAPNGTVLAFWGGKGSEDGKLNYPEGIAVDKQGYVYVCDQNNHRIQKFTSTGTYVAKWGSQGSGDGQFNVARSITADPSGFIYVADVLNRRIQKFTSDGAYVAKWGSQGTGDGQFTNEFYVAASDYGYIYVSDGGNNRVQKFTYDGEFVAKWGNQGEGNGQFMGLKGLCIDGSGFIYTVESLSSRAQKFTPSGDFLTTWGSYDKIIDGRFDSPMAIGVDGLGNVVVADPSARIQRFTPTLNTVLKIRAIDSDNAPLSGVKITSSTQPAGQTPIQCYTDYTGTAYIPGVNPGSYEIEAEKSGSTGTITVQADEGALNEAQVVLNTGPVLTDLKILVKDETGNPIPGVTVESTKQPTGQVKITGVTGADGYAQWSGIIPGDYTLACSKSGYTSNTSEVTTAPGGVNDASISLKKQSTSGNGGGIPGFPAEAIVAGILITVYLLGARTRLCS